MKYSHFDRNGHLVNFVEWDGETPFEIDGTLVPWHPDHEPDCKPQPPKPPTLLQRVKQLLKRAK